MNAALRSLQIGAAIVSFAGWNLLRRWGLIHPKQTPGEHFADALQRLGTTFVKLGQHLSLRPDLLPAGYIAALQNLQDHVAPFPGVQARATVEEALGAPIESVFASFDAEPFAAASIAQVHGAVLPDGKPVIVKVRRPGIVEQIDRDLRLALLTVRAAGSVIPALRQYRFAEIVSEVWSSLKREVDFRLEASNVRRFAEALRGLPGIKVPDVESRLCRERILVVERSHGARVDAVADPVQGRVLASRFVDAYLHQFFTVGAFHGDPHPGNLFITPEGEICFHDFGIVGTLDKATRRALAAFMLAFVDQDVDWLMDAWFEMGVLAPTAERAAFRRTIAQLLDDFSRMPIAQWSLGEAFQRLIAGGRGVGFKIPANLLVLGRAMLLIESTVRALDPQFSLLDALMSGARSIQATTSTADEQAGALRLKYETALISSDWRLAVAQALRQLRGDGFRLRVGSDELSRLSGSVENAAGRLATALVALGLYIAASLLLQHGLGPQLSGLPLLAVGGYVVALWLTWRVVRRGHAGR